jgi:hypothetical protein
LKSVFLALSMMLVAPAAVHASEITLVPAVKLQIGDQDNNGHYWDGGNWRDQAGGISTMSVRTITGTPATSHIMTIMTIITTTMTIMVITESDSFPLTQIGRGERFTSVRDV